MRRVFMIGWDGATFDLIRPWVAEGKLPTLARLMGAGTHGPLRSTMPPWTFPAWTSFMTGQNPGKHGIFDFFRLRPGSYNLEYLNGSHRRSPTFWQLLSEAGRKVVSISLPCTFPPDRLANGIMISGFDFPGEGPGSFVDATGMHPPELYAELKQAVGPHPIDAAVMKDVNAGRLGVALQTILHTLRQKAATARYLLRQKPWDCFMILFGESDGTGHQFWRYCDPQSPLFEDRPDLRDSLLRVYQELDRLAGELLNLIPPDTLVMMMSDHGFGGVGDWVIYPNAWLEEQGFVRLRRGPKPSAGLLNRLKMWGVAHLPAWFQRWLYRSCSGLLGRIEARVRFGMIDWAGTEAYFDENPYFPLIRINVKGRQPQGTVEPGTHYEAVRSRVIRVLESWRHPVTGAPIVEKALRREEVYSGPYVDQAADIIPQWALHQGYSYRFRSSAKAPAGVCIERVDPRRADAAQFYTGKSGTHREEGIFVAHGPGVVREGLSVTGARLIDLAPTLLHLLGVPVPADMDGRVLQEIFTDSFHAESPLRQPAAAAVPATEAAPLPAGPPAASDGYSAEEAAIIGQRLNDMGYGDD
jgi:predicted AlkP superfamily phosphohydrolase/phosphomutase